MQSGKTSRTTYIILFLSILFVVVIIIILYKPDKNSSSDACEIHRTFYLDKIDSGVVIEHFIDTTDHAHKIVRIQNKDKNYKLLFIPYDNWDDFEKIKTGDIISKDSKTFIFRLNDDQEFELNYDCYSKYHDN